jgi:hypothetical protein
LSVVNEYRINLPLPPFTLYFLSIGDFIMKKLTTIFILVFMAVGLFAEPKVPKLYNGEDEYSYTSNNMMYYYEINAGKNADKKFPFGLHFIKYSYVGTVKITLIINFENEKQLDTFIKDIHLSDIDNEFNRIRKQLILNNASMRIKTDNESRPIWTIYEIDGTKLKIN